jgi:hypothetical protein
VFFFRIAHITQHRIFFLSRTNVPRQNIIAKNIGQKPKQNCCEKPNHQAFGLNPPPPAYYPKPSIIIRQNAQPPAYTQDANYKKPALSSNYKIFEKYQNRTDTKKQIIILPSSATALPTAQNR